MTEYKVLVTLDGSHHAERALAYLGVLPSLGASEVLLISVVDESEDFHALALPEAREREANLLSTYLDAVSADIAEHLGIDLEALTGKFIVMPRRGLDNTLFAAPYDQPGFTALLGELEEQINDLHINVLFLDNIAQTYAGREADRHQVTKFINGIYGCARHQDFAPVIMGHPAKVAGSEYSGSTAWENAVRMRWYLGDRLPDENQDEGEAPDPKVRVLAKRKTNYSEKDWRRFTFEAGVLVPDTVPPAGSGIIGHLYDQAAERAVLDGLKRLQEMGMHPSEGATTSRYLPRLLLEYKLAEGRSKTELVNAMRRLMVAGRLVKAVVGKYAGNRSPMYGLTASE